MTIRLAHISDLHYGTISFHPSIFLSKRWIGNFNLMLFRNKAIKNKHLDSLPDLFQKLNIEAVCITGDLSSTSLDNEFQKAKNFIENVSSKIPILLIPGNHDCYTREVEKNQRFYSFFPKNEQGRIETKKIKESWWWIGMDSTLATYPFFSYGVFFESMENKLESVLQNIPEKDCVIVANHFPLISSNRPRHDLKNAEKLQKILRKYRQVKVYLHGHDHQPYIINGQNEGLPLIINAGTCSLLPKGSFFALELSCDLCKIEQYCYYNSSWILSNCNEFILD